MQKALRTLLKSEDHRLERRIALGLLLALALTVAIHFLSSTSIRHLLASDEKVMFNFELDNHLEDLDHELISLESNLRSYIISEASGLLGDLGTNMAEARDNLEQIARMAPNLPEIPGRIERLRELVELKLSFSESVLDSFSRSGQAAAIQLINTQEGLRLRDSIIRITSELRQLERQNITQTIAINRHEAQEVSKIDYLSTLLAAGIVFLALFYFLKSIEYRKATQLKLEEARREAEHSAQVKEQFVANMSHEIRTPLHAVLSFSELLSGTRLSTEQQELVDGIQLSGENLLTTVNDILDFSKMEAGMFRLESIPFQLSDLWLHLEKMFKAKAEAKQLQLSFNAFPKAHELLLGDPARLNQILINLIGNAIKFTDEGGIQIWGHLHQPAPDRRLLEVKVSDSGIGIAKEQIDLIFERFRQGETHTSRRHGGTGLGLAIVKHLVELQGGTVSCHSQVGQGSTFTVRIPYTVADRITTEASVSLPDVPADALPVFSRILLAEDNPLNQRIMALLFQEWGFSYDLAHSGPEAVQMAAGTDYDLIFLDIQLPELDGYEVARLLRNANKQDTFIIALTANSGPREREKCLQAGMNDYLSKPFRKKELLRLLLKYAKLKAGAEFAPRPLVRPAPDASEVELIDLEYLNSIANGKPERLQEMADLFLQQIPRELEKLNSAATRGELTSVARLAHSMRSTVAYMGMAHSLGPIIQRVEHMAAQATAPDTMKPLLAELRERLQQGMEEVQRQVSNSSA